MGIRHHESGTSVSTPGRIWMQGNARSGKALDMPSQVASQNESNVRTFYEKLLGRGQKPTVTIAAVKREPLHSIYGVLRHDQEFEDPKGYPDWSGNLTSKRVFG